MKEFLTKYIKLRTIGIIGIFLVPIYVLSMPAYPMAFWGTVTIDAVPAPINTTVAVYDATSLLLGKVTVLETGIYGYNNSLKQKLLTAEGTGLLTFKVKQVGGTEITGCSAVSYPSFSSGVTMEKNLAFRTSGCTTVPDGSGNATLSTTTPQVIITGGAATSVVVSSGTTNPIVDVSAFITGGSGTLPAISITSANANNTTVAIPASTVVTSTSLTWNGLISAPTVTTVTLPAQSGQTKTLSTAVEVGFSGEKLTFSKAVRLLLPGQSGKRAGYVRTGISFTEITAICALDNQTTGDALAADSECKIDVGSDLVIWTKHFTTFATYSQTTTPVSSSGTSISSGGSYFVSAPIIAPTSTPTTSPVRPLVATSSQNLFVIPPSTPVVKITTKTKTVYLLTTLDVLDIGSESDDVVFLQEFLQSAGFLSKTIVINGYFGQATKQAVKKFQTKYASELLTPNGFKSATGMVGEATRNKINELIAG